MALIQGAGGQEVVVAAAYHLPVLYFELAIVCLLLQWLWRLLVAYVPPVLQDLLKLLNLFLRGIRLHLLRPSFDVFLNLM